MAASETRRLDGSRAERQAAARVVCGEAPARHLEAGHAHGMLHGGTRGIDVVNAQLDPPSHLDRE